MTSRADIRRALALNPDKRAIAAQLAELAVAGPLSPGEVGEALVGYLFDPHGNALLATTDARATWLAGPLFRAVGPGNFAPIDDVVAAVIAGPLLAAANSEALLARRFAPRADDAIAFAIAALPEPRQADVLALLASDGGPEPQLLAQSTLQCGAVLAAAPHLLDAPIASKLVAELIALLAPSRPKPLLDQAARICAAIAARDHVLAERIRSAAFAAIDASHRPPPRTFAAEIAAIGRARRLPDEDRLLALPQTEVAQAAAYILGACAPLERVPFAAHRALVLERPDGADLADAFTDGLVAAAHVPALAELAASLLDADADAPLTGLGLANALPLDPIAERLIAELENERPSHRALACGAVMLLDHPAVEPALAARLGDPSSEIAAAAARALVERGRGDLIADHASREAHPLRGAIARAATGELSVAVIGELVTGASRELGDEPGDVTPIVRLLGDCLFGSIDGLDTCASLIGGVPDAIGLVALAASADLGDNADIGVIAPPDARARLASIVMDQHDAELVALGTFVLARVSAGDAGVADLAADGLAATAGHADSYLAALAAVRTATPKTAAALAAMIGGDQPIGARVLAAAACGRALPVDHPAWADVRALLELGTIARAAAWTALRDRARKL
ncbi:MAG TPA: hypothetical protein VH143_26410 [Kofleriaceae bacterium]|jgi:hypothetical protein|nr:hypothetical protein [Kofleriaceae bacterium]